MGCTIFESQTDLPAWADAAIRCPVGAADGGAQLHQGLRKIARILGVDSFQKKPDLFFCVRKINGSGIIPQPGKNPENISVHCRRGEGKCNGAYGTGGIFSNTGKREDLAVRLRKLTMILSYKDLCRFFQIPYPAVVSQPFP